MSITDIILLIIIGGFALGGLYFGFVHTLGSLIGTLLGVYLASRYFDILAGWLSGFLPWNGNGIKVIVFVLAFLIINRLVGFVFWFLEKFIGFITRLPFIRSINGLLGFLLGIAEGIITIGVVVYIIERFPLSTAIMRHLAASRVAPYALSIASILIPLVPEGIRILKSTLDFVEHKFVELRR